MTITHYFWKRSGWQVPIVTISCCIATQFLVNFATHDDEFFQNNLYALPAALLAAAVLLYFLDKHAKKMVQMIEGRQNTAAWQRRRGTFLSIPVTYWAFILAGCSMIALIIKMSLHKTPSPIMAETKVATSELAEMTELPALILIAVKGGHTFIIPKRHVTDLSVLQNGLQSLAGHLNIPYNAHNSWEWK